MLRSDAELVAALRAGDEDAFRELVREWHAPLLRVARIFTPSRAVAEEVVQETWLRVLGALDRFEGRSSLKTWVFRILVNTAMKRGTRLAEGVPSCVHPVVRTHPATGRKALYVNRLMTVRIEGLPADESDALLDTLFAHQERREFVYEHVWRPGDLLMWDNRCTLHARTDFSPEERRLMRRVTILGEKPV